MLKGGGDCLEKPSHRCFSALLFHLSTLSHYFYVFHSRLGVFHVKTCFFFIFFNHSVIYQVQTTNCIHLVAAQDSR